MISGLRRTSTPTVPMPNSTAASTRYHVVVGTAVGDHDVVSADASVACFGARRASSTVPTTAITSSTDVSSNAST